MASDSLVQNSMPQKDTFANQSEFAPEAPAKSRPFWKILPFIDPESEAAQHLKDHKYSGSDLGFAYTFFYNPVANWAVEFLPKTLAPNTVTLLGFFHTLLPVVLLYVLIGPEL